MTPLTANLPRVGALSVPPSRTFSEFAEDKDVGPAQR